MPPLPPELVGAKISVITTKEIRYEGILYEVRQDESSFRLHEVKSFGTEGRVKKGKKVPPGDVYKGYVDIKGSDIKDIKLIDVIDSEKGDEWPEPRRR
jgi:protein LSM14